MFLIYFTSRQPTYIVHSFYFAFTLYVPFVCQQPMEAWSSSIFMHNFKFCPFEPFSMQPNVQFYHNLANLGILSTNKNYLH